jgi:class 3 adenylate cyclase
MIEDWAMNNDPYSVAKDEAGNLTIRDKAGEIVVEDYEDQRYCDFLTWKSHQGPCKGPDFFLDWPLFFFSELDRLIPHCKENGIILYAIAPTQLAVWNSGFLPAGQRLLKQPPSYFSGLCKTIASNDEQASIRGAEAGIFVSLNLWLKLNSSLHDETGDARRLTSLPITRTFVYIDVSDFTKAHPGHQALIVNSILAVVNKESIWHYGFAHAAYRSFEASLCIGDGYIFVFKEPMFGTFFAAYLARLLEELIASKKLPVAFHFRMGIHVGPVFCFWDTGRKDWNYIGDGINGGNRVLQAIGKETDDVLFISDRVRQELIARNSTENPYQDILACLHNRGRKADKHGNLWRVYELRHFDMISRKEMPTTLDI